MEAGVVISIENKPIYWHLPDGRNDVALPHSRELFFYLLKNKDIISGFAHSHPGSGIPGPSFTDLTTFAAVELGLGKRLNWWITSSSHLIVVRWAGVENTWPTDEDRLNYKSNSVFENPEWLEQLKGYSLYKKEN